MHRKQVDRTPEPTATPVSKAETAPEAAEVVETAADALAGALSFPVVGIGASAGGLEAFKRLLEVMPADTGMAFVLVQHLAATHPSALADILGRSTTMPVTEVQDEPRIKPNRVYVIPPGREMVISKGSLHLFPREPGPQHRPIDRFLRSLAEAQGYQSIGVILSGVATDGTLGLEAIKAEGGITFAQDQTAQQDGMPRSAIDSGCVDFVMPPDQIAAELARISRLPYAAIATESNSKADGSDFKSVTKLLHDRTGVDFSDYKPNTLSRRVNRRVILSKSDGVPSYLNVLRESSAEVEALFQDVLISVTSFFRDPDSFEALKSKVFPDLVSQQSGQESLRVWSIGCSSGEEVYSLAIAFTEFAEAVGCRVPFQFFATDLNSKGIDHARAGLYHKGIEQDVSPERLARFFIETDGGYRIVKSIRDVCVFSKHNVLADPPFSRIDLISCRNMLIYLEPVLQQRILPLLHYALKPTGVLWLGRSESIGSHRDLFEVKDAKHKIFVKKHGSSSARALFAKHLRGPDRAGFGSPRVQPSSEQDDLDREASRLLLSRFAPPSVLISADYEILRYRGDTSPYLAPAPGKASLNLLKMLREGLLVGVRSALVRASRDGASAREDGMRVTSADGYRDVVIEAVPLQGSGEAEAGFLVLFHDAASPIQVPHETETGRRVGPQDTTHDAAQEAASAAELVISRLTRELASTREYLQAVIE
ncbi:MAG: chemotaxis protein CheB, partial [Isosphaeraceae bacterium]